MSKHYRLLVYVSLALEGDDDVHCRGQSSRWRLAMRKCFVPFYWLVRLQKVRSGRRGIAKTSRCFWEVRKSTFCLLLRRCDTHAETDRQTVRVRFTRIRTRVVPVQVRQVLVRNEIPVEIFRKDERAEPDDLRRLNPKKTKNHAKHLYIIHVGKPFQNIKRKFQK
jgi:hypothetical protein